MRLATGLFTNSITPVAFSFVGDLFTPEARSLPSTIITAAMRVY